MNARRLFAAMVSVSALAAAAPARGAAVFTFSQVDGSIVGTLSGSLNVSGAVNYGTTSSYDPRIGPKYDELIATPGNSGNGLTGSLFGATGPSSFGTGDEADGTATGGVFEVEDGYIILPAGYAGGSLTNTLTVPNATFASEGITPSSSYVYTLAGSNDTVTVQFTSVPEPASLGVLAVAGGIVGLRRPRHRR